MRRTILTLVSVLALTMGLGVPTALAEPQDYLLWSECLYNKPAPSNSAIVDVYTAPYSIKLDCGGVRHIKAGHGFDHYTEGCIAGTLRKGNKQTSKTDSTNWLFRTQMEADGFAFEAFVVVTKASAKVVTAYTESNVSPDDDWKSCWTLYK